MKTLSAILCLSLASCGVTLNEDGSKAVTVDAVAIAKMTEYYAQKAERELNKKSAKDSSVTPPVRLEQPE